MSTTRISREDSKARTRADLLAASRSVFLRRGFHVATLDEIAEEAGYTKGAVYSNFAGKDDLFLALLDAALRGERRALRDADARARRPGRTVTAPWPASCSRRTRSEPAWWPLVSDFATHASRNERLATRLRAARDRFIDSLARTIEAPGARHAVTFALPPREVARGTGALLRGMAVEWQIDDTPARDEVFEEMLAASSGPAVPPHERSTA